MDKTTGNIEIEIAKKKTMFILFLKKKIIYTRIANGGP